MGTELLAIFMPANIIFCFEMLSDTVNFQLVPKGDLYDTLVAEPFNLATYKERQSQNAESNITAESEEGAEKSSLG